MPMHIRRCYYTPLFLQHCYAIEVLYVLKTKALQTPKSADKVFIPFPMKTPFNCVTPQREMLSVPFRSFPAPIPYKIWAI